MWNKITGISLTLVATMSFQFATPVFADSAGLQKTEIDFKPFLTHSLPDKGMYVVQEEYRDGAGMKHANEFRLYLTKNYRTAGIEYLDKNSGPLKRIIFLNSAEDIWTLDRTGGRLRKKAYTQRMEIMNQSDVTYWDFFLTQAINPYSEVIRKYFVGDSSIAFKIRPDEKCFYKKAVIYVHKKDSKIMKILLYRNMRYIAKKIQFHYLPRPNQNLIYRITTENFKTGAHTSWTIKKHLAEKKLPAVFERGKALF